MADVSTGLLLRNSRLNGSHSVAHWFYLFTFCAVDAEIVWYMLVQKRSYPWREMFASLGISVMRIPVKLMTPLIVMPMAFFLYSHRVMTVPLGTARGCCFWPRSSPITGCIEPGTRSVGCGPHMSCTTRPSISISPAPFASERWLFFLPLSLLGFNPLAVTAMVTINLFYQFWQHTDLIGRLGVSLRGRPPSPDRPDTLRRWLGCRLRSGDGWGGRGHHRSGASASMEC
jgi:hypothetical protein